MVNLSWPSCLKQCHAYFWQIGENSSYKVGWLKIGYNQEGRIEPEYPKSQISSQVDQSTSSMSIEWGKETIPNVNLQPFVVLDSQVWLLISDRDERSHLLFKVLCLISEESGGQRLWEGLRKMDRLQALNRLKLEGSSKAHAIPLPHYVNSPRLHVALGDFWLRRSSL